MAKLTHTAPQACDFSASTRRALLSKGIAIVGTQAVPAFDGDRYFSGRAYMLAINGCGCLRSFREVLTLAGA